VNTAIFSLLDQLRLRLLPVKNPRELPLFTMRGQHCGSNWGCNSNSHPMYRDFQHHNVAGFKNLDRRGLDKKLRLSDLQVAAL
jgi:hypothetical protein